MSIASKGVVPQNTQTATQWAVKNFEDWATFRGDVPQGILESRSAEDICHWLRLFVLETRKSDGSEYPPATLRSLVCGLNRVIQNNGAPFSVLNKADHRFRDLLKTLDFLSSTLHSKGIGATKESASVIEVCDEDVFWCMSLVGYSSPKVLQRTVFFYVGLNFVLRGVQEQYDLVPSQFVRYPPDTAIYNADVFYEYVEYISKNNQHSFKDINMKNKCTRAYAIPQNDRCIVKLLDTYLGILPEKASYFYLRALEDWPEDHGTKQGSCFVNQRVGLNTLKGILPDICKKARFENRYTNHSLRATAITRMLNSGIPEKVIAEQSGHRSLKALRCYEHTSLEQQLDVTKAINQIATVEEVEKKEEAEKENVAPIADEKPLIKTEAEESATSSVPGLSGCFTNCTINISLK